jgi:hypothetical protein
MRLYETICKLAPDMVSRIEALDSGEMLRRACRELERRQSGIFAIPDDELVPEALRVCEDYLRRTEA